MVLNREKFFVQVRGGTEDEREDVKDRFKNLSTSSDVDIDLVKVESLDPDLSVLIHTPCGEVKLSRGDLENGSILASACETVSCKSEKTVVAEGSVSDGRQTDVYVEDKKVAEIVGPAKFESSVDVESGEIKIASEPSKTGVEIDTITLLESSEPKKEASVEDDIPGDDGN